MREDLQKLVNAIKLAQSRGAYSLEESAIIYQLLLGLSKCPELQEKSDLVITDDDDIVMK